MSVYTSAPWSVYKDRGDPCGKQAGSLKLDGTGFKIGTLAEK